MKRRGLHALGAIFNFKIFVREQQLCDVIWRTLHRSAAYSGSLQSSLDE
jgi:hypothetical protein